MTNDARDGFTSRLTGGLFALGVVILVVGVLVGAVAPGASLPLTDGGGDAVRQIDPATAGAEGDLSPIEQRLAGQVLDRVRSGALNLSAEDRENAVSSLEDSEFDGLLSRYRGVANRTGNRNTTRFVIRLQRTQQHYAVLFDRYWDLHGTYENQTTAGSGGGTASESLTPPPRGFARPSVRRLPDDTPTDGNRSRQIAREMERTWLRLNETGHRLVEQYRATGNATGTAYAESIQAVTASVANVSRTQAEVRREAFVRTRFDTLDVGSTDISFTDPLRVQGRLETTAGEAIRNRTLNVTVGNRTLPVRLETDGRFTLTYRPTRLLANTTELRLAFRPPNGSIYLGTRTTLDVHVSQVTPKVRVAASPDGVGYGENLTISGEVTAGSAGVPGAPYVVLVGNRVVRGNETGDGGQFERTVSVPSDIRTGDTSVVVRVGTSGAAIGNASGSATVAVSKTDTAIELSATRETGREVRVSGRFLLEDGEPVPGERVEISADGRFLASLETEPDGSFGGVVLVPSALGRGSESTVSITASYERDVSTLDASAASAGVRVGARDSSVVPIALGFLVLVLVAGLLLWWRPWTSFLARTREQGRGNTGSDVEGGPDLSLAGDDPTSSSLLAVARKRHEAGAHGDAVQLGYAALRSRLTPAIEGEGGQTHWEFYQACRRAKLDEGTTRTLRTVTEAYERFRFAADSVSEDTAREILDSIAGLEPGTQQGGTDD